MRTKKIIANKVIQTFIVSCFFLYSANMAAAASGTTDPCNEIAGTWTGHFYDFQTDCSCWAVYGVYQSYSNVSFDLSLYNCSKSCVPPNFTGQCVTGKFTADFDPSFSGIVYDAKLEFRNKQYYIELTRPQDR